MVISSVWHLCEAYCAERLQWQFSSPKAYVCVWYWLPEVGGTYVFIFISKLAPVTQYHRMPAGKDNKITPHYCLSVDTLPLTPNPQSNNCIARRNNKACVCASNNVTCSTFCSILERPTNQMGLRSGCNITKPTARALVSMFLWIWIRL